jgi:hypothetical protein
MALGSMTPIAGGLTPETSHKLGRPKGSRNKTLIQRMSDAETFARTVIDDPDYYENLKLRARTGTLSPACEGLLWYYAFGKPVNRVEISTNGADLSEVPIDELADRCKQLAEAAVVLHIKKTAIDQENMD